MKRKCISILFGILFLVCGNVVAEQEITVCGTGDSQSLLRVLAEAFEQSHPGSTINVPDSIGSSGGIKATAKGKCELGRVARPVKKKEEKYGLRYRVFAISPVVFAVNSSVKGVESISAKQISGIYSGVITNWSKLGGDNQKIYIVNREEGDSSRSVLEKKLPGFGDIKNFAGKIIYTTPKAVETILRYKGTIGYTALGSVAGKDVTVLKIDGKYPSKKHVRSGLYSLVSPFGIVWKDELSGLSKQFSDFLYSPDAKRIIAENGLIPAE